MNSIFIGRFGRHNFSIGDLLGKTESTAGSAGESPRPFDRFRAGMNSGIGNSAETAPPFVSFGFTFRGLARGLAAACLFGLVLLLGATQALAQTSVNLVSNINQAINSRTSVFQDNATQFVTGSHAQGYKLTSVDLKIREALSVPHTVEIRSSVEDSTPGRLQNGNQRHYPGTLVGTLTNPATLTANADNNYKASGSGIDLEPETSYWLVIDHTPSGSGDGSNFQLTESTNETGLSGWSISPGIETRAYTPDPQIKSCRK